jgi:5-methylcytosine-specific restriction endonuclease McrA
VCVYTTQQMSRASAPGRRADPRRPSHHGWESAFLAPWNQPIQPQRKKDTNKTRIREPTSSALPGNHRLKRLPRQQLSRQVYCPAPRGASQRSKVVDLSVRFDRISGGGGVRPRAGRRADPHIMHPHLRRGGAGGRVGTGGGRAASTGGTRRVWLVRGEGRDVSS